MKRANCSTNAPSPSSAAANTRNTAHFRRRVPPSPSGIRPKPVEPDAECGRSHRRLLPRRAKVSDPPHQQRAEGGHPRDKRAPTGRCVALWSPTRVVISRAPRKARARPFHGGTLHFSRAVTRSASSRHGQCCLCHWQRTDGGALQLSTSEPSLFAAGCSRSISLKANEGRSPSLLEKQ